ncbi:MAG: NAD(P)/FAD-dependent oxidoreductase [Bryobacterales bacterium]|nr:NAD(P)/FAD-dependent oxidoreductase [Bryobacterales bacterium]
MGEHCPVAIIGAGPAGLTAAWELVRRGSGSILVESLGQVGGLARTERYRGFHFDIGGHRFFTKVEAVENLWHEILGRDLLERSRLSRIFLDGRFYQYPINAAEVVRKMGPAESVRCGLSYVRAHLQPRRPVRSVEDWLINHFGERLYRRFFKTYTEKVWGIACSEISADWAAQRIRGLSVLSVLRDALGLDRNRPAKSLIRSFLYPRRGPGMMWERAAEVIEESGSEVRLNTDVEEIHWEPGRVKYIVAGGRRLEAAHFLSSMPVRELIAALRPRVPELDEVGSCFQYRDFLTVALIIRQPNPFPDNWIYVHDPEVSVGRIQNFNNWSPEMTPDPAMTCLGMEYFCSEGDALWNMTDEELKVLGRREIGVLKLADPDCVQDAAVVRAPKAYPVYNGDHQRGLEAVRRFLEGVPNLQLIGRNGMHRYNNQDHSMVTAMLAVENIFGAKHNLWDVNVDEEYAESGVRVSREEAGKLQAQQPLPPKPVVDSAAAGSR